MEEEKRIEALKRFKASLEKKRAQVEKMENYLRTKYKETTGEEVKQIFSM